MRWIGLTTGVACAALVLSPGVGAASVQSAVFNAPATYQVGWAPFSVGTGDFDGDAVVDLAVPNHLDSTVSILDGRGDGTFRSTATVAVGSRPLEVVERDFNEDGHQDLATANSGSGENGHSVSILLGSRRGTLSLTSHIPFGYGSEPFSIAAGDLDDDGHVDLVAPLHGYATVGVLLGRGDGSFTRAPDLEASYGSLTGIAVTDLNADGHPDVVAADHYYSDVVVFLGRGDGSFAASQRYGVGSRPTNVVVADLDSDGRPDLVTVNDLSYTEQVSLLMGNGDGSFQPVRYVSLSQTNGQAVAVTAGDFNGDCHTDLATADGAATVSVLLGDGLGDFVNAQPFQVGSEPYLLTAADFNGDGRSDLAIPNQGDYPGTVSVALANTDVGC